MSSIPEAPALPHTSNSRAVLWVMFAAAGLIMALAAALWHESALLMLKTWGESDTFAHGPFVAPLAAWLIWKRRHDMDWSALSPSWWGVVGLAGTALLWMAGELAGVNGAGQLALVGVIPMALLALLGSGFFFSALFPLAFLLFMVPVGDFLQPMMMEHTADITVWALKASGIPVFREGLFFMLPSGQWSVVEACSGLRYLIASMVLGCLYAYLNYRSWKLRLAFIALSILVPIVANWVRAYLIVMVGHLSSMKVAAGADHLVYGWAFFGIVMALLFWIGGRWNDPVPAEGSAPVPTGQINARFGGAGIVIALASAAVLLASVQAAQALRDATVIAVKPTAETLGLQANQAGGFAPHFSGAQWAVSGEGAWLGHYAKQHESGEMVGYSNTLIPRDNEQWRTVDTRTITLASGLTVLQSQVTFNGARTTVWQWYVIGSDRTTSNTKAKILTALRLLSGRGDASYLAAVWNPGVPDIKALEAAANALNQRIDSLATAR
jgi:exosortase A